VLLNLLRVSVFLHFFPFTMTSSSSTLDARITSFVADVVKTESVEESFNLFLVHRSSDREQDVEEKCLKWNSLCAEVNAAAPALESGSAAAAAAAAAAPNQAVESALAIFVGVMSQQKNAKTLG
jgi:hypothetical protein